MGLHPARPSLTREAFIWLAVVILVTAARFFTRFRYSKLRADDGVMVLALCTYIMSVVGIYVFDGVISNINFASIQPSEAHQAGKQIGTLIILVETCTQTMLWAIKACFLIIFYRYEYAVTYRRVVQVLCIYVFLTYITVLVAFFGGWCRPISTIFKMKTDIPPDKMECVYWYHYFIIQIVCDLSSNLLIFLVPTVMLARTHLPLSKKLFAGCMFALAIFTIACSVVLKILALIDPSKPGWHLWTIRFLSSAMIVANALICFPLIRRLGWAGKRPMTSHSSRVPHLVLSSNRSEDWETALYQTRRRLTLILPDPEATQSEEITEKQDKALPVDGSAKEAGHKTLRTETHPQS
ncbi:hypothetical protein BT63DRAFT_457077 [Microthyrium microscopicum]|uniref:Rhodopsin domain-containing protein n=1 Tax=Microthyrium microscopicum TaxID=703497 RepID=A0A6A6U807_9PEZI|nr:hypothetical protein BT63DRAFT_457077 [Microthyrium microscopicum]